MPLKNIVFLLLFSLICFNRGQSQQYYFKNYSAENGLPFVQVYAMYQDSKGFLYTGGYSGVSRFDGKEFTNITTHDGLAANDVNAIGEDEKGRILVGTKNGLSILENNAVWKGKLAGLTAEMNISCVKKGSNNEVYIGSQKGLYRFKDNSLQLIKGTENDEIRDIIFVDKQLYCATNSGLISYDKGTIGHVTVKNGLASNNINCLALSKDLQTMAIGTANGLSFYNLKSGKIVSYFIENGLIDNAISALLFDHQNNLWIGSHTGLIKYENNEFNYYNIYYDNNSNLIRCLIQDAENNVWVGTHSGLFRYRDNSFSTFDKINGPGNAFIYEIFRSNTNLFVCSENNGIYKYSQGYFKRYGISDGLPSNICRSGTVTRSGRLLFVTDGGLAELKNEKFNKIPTSKLLKAPFYKVFCDTNDLLWIGGTNGVSTVSLTSSGKADTSFYKLPTAKEEFVVTDICEDEKGNKWIAAYGCGLFKIKDKTIIDYGKKIGITTNEFASLKYANNNLYLATLSGLMIVDLNKDTYQLITTEDGLISDIVYSIGFAKNKTVLWVGTNIGVSELNLEELKKNKVRINSFGKTEGFVGIECNSNGVYEDTDGTVWFGTINGLIKHIPNKYQHNTRLNKLNIYKFKLADVDTMLFSDVEIPFSNNNITFYYRGICLTNPDKVLYSKKLEGYDAEYSLPSEESNAKYTNLTPGTYTFNVISCNNEGIWNDKPTSFVFTILTPFYRTWWFVLFALLAIISSVYLVFKIRLNNLKTKQQKDYERKVEMSKMELKALRSQMNPHFVFNSLNSIQHYILNTKSDEAVKYLNKFAKLMRVILNNSDKPTVAIEDDIEGLKLYLELEQMRFEEKFEYKIEIDPNVDMDYDIMPPMLLQPYVENAILHGLTPRKEKGLLTIGIRNEGHFIVCTIKDNGIGRKKSSEIKRMMPGNKHKSLGMKITEERLRILNEISRSEHSVKITDLENADGSSAGTMVELYVPIL